MNLPVIIETSLSVLTVIILLSLISSAVLELLGRFNRGRSKLLRKAITQALEDPGITKNYGELLYNHQLLKSFRRTNLDMPSYIAPLTFSSALIETVVNEFETESLRYDSKAEEYLLDPSIAEEESIFKKYKMAQKAMGYGQLSNLLKSFIGDANDISGLKTNITVWYNDYMDRISGWYKRGIQKQLLVIGFIVAASINVDLVYVSTHLYQHAELRKELVVIGNALQAEYFSEGENAVNTRDELQTSSELLKEISTNSELLLNSSLPIGWHSDSLQERNIFLRILGWLVAAAAITRGAPFWFNLLSKVVNIRSTGNTPGQKTEKS